MRVARPTGIKLLAIFFGFGAMMCGLTTFLLLFPKTRLDSLWRLNPVAQQQLTGMGGWAVLLMLTVGAVCALAAIGLARGARWGRMLAIGMLAINLIGDVIGALLRNDPRTLIGVPIGGAMIFYLARRARSTEMNADARGQES
jgi:hypothetical protein